MLPELEIFCGRCCSPARRILEQTKLSGCGIAREAFVDCAASLLPIGLALGLENVKE